MPEGLTNPFVTASWERMAQENAHGFITNNWAVGDLDFYASGVIDVGQWVRELRMMTDSWRFLKSDVLDKGLLEDFARVLTPDGYAGIQLPVVSNPEKAIVPTLAHYSNVWHVDEFRQAVSDAGLKPVTIRTDDNFGFHWLRKA